MKQLLRTLHRVTNNHQRGVTGKTQGRSHAPDVGFLIFRHCFFSNDYSKKYEATPSHFSPGD
ncbi:MAG: hypothetical protein ABIQ31_21670 [Ferruginibacter sp.]